MSFDIIYPKITANTGEGKIEQIRAYLFSLADQLKFALNSIDTNASTILQQSSSSKGKTQAISEEEAQATFNSIKSLIIKSADIIEAYSEAITERYSGQYVAKSDFGTYINQTEQTTITNSESVTNLFNSMQKIISDIEELDRRLIEVNAHTRAGLLYYNSEGVPIYGFEIGQKNSLDGVEIFNKYARFTADKLSFYDKNDTEVAYISDYKLYITNAQITGTLTLGRYELDPSDGLAIKWV